MHVEKKLDSKSLENPFAHLLMWDEEKGYGRLTSSGFWRNDFFDHYVDLSTAPETTLLYKIRHKVCRDYAPDIPILDFGVGNGEFIKRKREHELICGYDVDEDAIAWLNIHGCWLDFWTMNIPNVVTFWDSLEHLEHIDTVIRKCPLFIICSMPVYNNREEVLKSKHFRPNEHVWYFSETGLINFMFERGFEVKFSGDLECLIGRENICTFVFRRYEV